MNPNKKEELKRSVKFLVFSVGAGLIQIVSAMLLDKVFGVESHIAYLVGLILSILFNFTVNRRYTFKSASNVPIAMLKVAAFYLVFTPLSTWLVEYMVYTLHIDSFIADLCVMVLNFALEFPYQRFFVFRKTLDTNRLAKKTEAH